MLRLTQRQFDQLVALEGQRYVDTVCDAVLAEHPAAGEDARLRGRLEEAHRQALLMGFTDGPAITQFLFYEAFAPSFHVQPAIAAWLKRPGAPIEDRFADLLEAQVARTREL